MAHQHEGAQESQPAPWAGHPQLPPLAVTFPSPSFHYFLFPGLLFFLVSASLLSQFIRLAFLLTPNLCFFVSQSLFLSHSASILLPPLLFP